MEVKSQLGIAANFDPEINSYNLQRTFAQRAKMEIICPENELLFAIGDIAIKADRKDEARKYLKESFEGPASDPYIEVSLERYADLEFNEGIMFTQLLIMTALWQLLHNKDIERITERNNS